MCGARTFLWTGRLMTEEYIANSTWLLKRNRLIHNGQPKSTAAGSRNFVELADAGEPTRTVDQTCRPGTDATLPTLKDHARCGAWVSRRNKLRTLPVPASGEGGMMR